VDVPGEVPVEEELVRTQEKRAGPAGRIEDPYLRNVAGCLVLRQLSNRMLDDVVHDVLRSVVNTTGLLHLRLVFDLCLVASCEPDYLPQELLVDLAENNRGDDRKLVGALGII